MSYKKNECPHDSSKDQITSERRVNDEPQNQQDIHLGKLIIGQNQSDQEQFLRIMDDNMPPWMKQNM